ncbi:Vacuolar inheritance and morphology protein [Exserohilum turcicum]
MTDPDTDSLLTADDDGGGFHSFTGAHESAEPAHTSTTPPPEPHQQHAQHQQHQQHHHHRHEHPSATPATGPGTPAKPTSKPSAAATTTPTTTTTTTTNTNTNTNTTTTAFGTTTASSASSSTTTTTTPPPSATEGAASASSMRQHTLAGQRPLHAAASPSPPLSSREASPARPHQRNVSTTARPTVRPGFRSRKSSTDASPSRMSSLANSTTPGPTAVVVQRAHSATSIPEMTPASTPSSSNDTIRAPRPSRPGSKPGPVDSTPLSPRFKSPPPAGDIYSHSRRNSLRAQLRKQEVQSTPAIIVESSSPMSPPRLAAPEDALASEPEEPTQTIKAPGRGAGGLQPKLETVQESSSPATPGFHGLEPQSFVPSAVAPKFDPERNDVNSSKVTEDLSSRLDSSKHDSSKHTESGSDSATKGAKKGKMQERRSAYAQRPYHSVSAKPSLSSMSTRSRDPPLRNMTVETETVPSVAQASIVNQDRVASGRADGGVRLRPSNETIRPKKEKKPTKRKAASINAGTASSKADVFEQKVASAVDEADSSDSDATFIYESNPPEQPHRSRQHHHSRTPSMTSLASLTDPRLQLRDNQKHPSKKSSIKFTNPYSNPSIDGDDRGEGTVRLGSGRAGGGSHHHHIGGRYGQGRGALNPMVMDSDSSMPQSSRTRGPASRNASQPNSPRFHTFSVGNGHTNGNKKSSEYSAAYDIDAEHAADDERTPLISGRSPRARTPRQRNSATVRQLERRHRRDGGWCRRFAGCLVLSILLLVVVFCAVGLVFATTKPLTSLMVRDIQNVVASQEEVILDLIVDAVNPNIIGVTVADMDVSVFAKSKHVGSDTWWREHGNGPPGNMENWKPIQDEAYPTDTAPVSARGIDEGTDPIEGEPRTMLLGRVYRFDSPLTFEGSFFQRHRAESIGELRLGHPGNKTEAGGSERWEEVLQYPFELIVRGNFKYTLPLSTQEFKVPVTASHYYDPDIEKRKRPTALPRHEKRRNLPSVPTKPWGRYDRRALALWHVQ